MTALAVLNTRGIGKCPRWMTQARPRSPRKPLASDAYVSPRDLGSAVIGSIDEMKERPHHTTAPTAAVAKQIAPCVATGEKHLVCSLLTDHRVMELMTAEHSAQRTERAGGRETRLAIAEVQPSFGKRRRQRQQARHGMR